MDKNFKTSLIAILITSIIISSLFGGVMGFWAGTISSSGQFSLLDWVKETVLRKEISNSDAINNLDNKKVVKIQEESAVINAVEKVSPTVVSIIVTKDLPVIEQYYSEPYSSDFFKQFFGDGFDDFFGSGVPQYRQKGTEKREVGGGTGFIVSSDGYIVTNKHVVLDEEAEYTVLMNDESKHEAKVLARDPMSDLAILKINKDNLPYVELGDSSVLKVGQTVIAIGNALGEFRNTVSTGVISGLARSVIAGGAGIGSEQLIGVIQTDASINPGNSGGPLLNIAGQVIGINTAMATGAENIGFAIPINEVKNTIDSVRENGRIIRPWLGVRHVQINKAIAEANKLEVDYGALIVQGEERTDLAVIPGSPADKAGLVESDIVLKVNGKKVDEKNPLAKALNKFKPGDEITLLVLHRGEEKEIKVVLEEMK
ncbi:MAG: trypsin-like peptidase domain-containing protein [Patescibacteria group bacterium]